MYGQKLYPGFESLPLRQNSKQLWRPCSEEFHPIQPAEYLKFIRELRRYILKQLAVLCGKGGGLVTIDIDFTEHSPVRLDRYDDLRAGFQAAREVARVGIYVIDDYRLTAGGCCATDSRVEWNPGVRGGLADVGAEDQLIILQQLYSDPVKVRALAME